MAGRKSPFDPNSHLDDSSHSIRTVILLVVAILAAGLVAAGFLACDSFSFFEELDGTDGVALEISPLAATMPVNEIVSFTVRGGFPPHALTATDGLLSQSPTDPSVWRYTAPNLTGTNSITVTDSRSNQKTAAVNVILVGPLFLTPGELSAEVGHTAVLTAVGGNPHPVSGYSFSATGGTVTKLTPTTARLSGLSAPGAITVTATDDVGATSDATVTVTSTVALAISPSNTTMVTGSTLTYTAYGGQPPYVFTTSAGPPFITAMPPDQAQFTAPPVTNSFTVTVTDDASDSALANVTVEAPGPLAISPSAITLLVNQKVTFTGSGGVGPDYIFVKTAGPGSLTTQSPSTSEYTAPLTAGSATIRVTDSDTPGNTANANVTVVAPLSISPVAVTITSGRSHTFAAAGGDSAYTYAVVSGGGSFAGGTYTAPLSGGTAVVGVTDGLGNHSEATVTITAVGPLTISPTMVTLRRQDGLTFHASGGESPYIFSVVFGDGAIGAGTGDFTAGQLAGDCVVRVTDSAGPSNMSDATVSAIWLIDAIHSIDDAGKYASLTLDASGHPHVSYFVENTQDLWYASWNGSSWNAQAVDSTSDVGEYTSLVLDTAGRPHIAYYDKSNKDLRYAYWDGAGWVRQTVDGADDVGKYANLELNGSDHARISYYDSNNKDLKYAEWDGASWTLQTVDSSGDVGEYTSLELDASGHPHIAYYDHGNENLNYAQWNGASWDISTVDGGHKRGKFCSLDLDASDWPAISYYDDDNKDLRYAYRNGGGWSFRAIDTADNVGKFTSLVLDAAGAPHISYWDETNRDLKISHWNGSTDLLEVVSGHVGDVGEHSSMAIDGTGRIKVVYYDADDKDLLFAE